jgi:hypothetical protein
MSNGFISEYIENPAQVGGTVEEPLPLLKLTWGQWIHAAAEILAALYNGLNESKPTTDIST